MIELIAASSSRSGLRSASADVPLSNKQTNKQTSCTGSQRLKTKFCERAFIHTGPAAVGQTIFSLSQTLNIQETSQNLPIYIVILTLVYCYIVCHNMKCLPVYF